MKKLILTSLIILPLASCSLLPDTFSGLSKLGSKSISGGGTGGNVGEATVNATAGDSEFNTRSILDKKTVNNDVSSETSNDKVQLAGKLTDQSKNISKSNTETFTDTSSKNSLIDKNSKSVFEAASKKQSAKVILDNTKQDTQNISKANTDDDKILGNQYNNINEYQLIIIMVFSIIFGVVFGKMIPTRTEKSLLKKLIDYHFDDKDELKAISKELRDLISFLKYSKETNKNTTSNSKKLIKD